ncbi:radical SAM protein [Caldicellulosiruptor naganoensis]|uniref:Radical SAM protein n=1 Tax=Caldicellulosiruptor naganoensis TaxID=29324 RepID=A0ABY7BJM9_9FIRM|nr:radical SAM protein [Caldicellulosiruptor naganoensis]WAM32087.1 radical SAM protein [Caldicellulosiruptor naganoensis]
MELPKRVIGEAVLKQVIRYLANNPEENMGKILDLTEKIVRRERDKWYIQNAKKYLLDPNSSWHHYAMRIIKETNPKVRERILINFFLNAGFIGVPKQLELIKKYDINIPYAILIDPTAACNLHCKGCWAGEYHKAARLEYEVLDRVVKEAQELGIYFIIFSGGEPLLRKDDILKLCEKYEDTVFLSFTNATLIDDEFIEKVAKVGNLAFAISIDGFEKSTDERRGPGVFKKVVTAMEKLKEAGVVFGFSTTYHRYNVEEVSSDEYIDFLIEKGAKFGWYFTYVPVGKDADVSYMATPEQRAYMYKRIEEIRWSKPIFVLDFWNDGEPAGGCIAGGRRYLHINANGDVEPCAFIHFSNVNIKECSLLDALKSPLFMAYRKNIPFNENHLRPCPMIDNPLKLKQIVEESGARPTQIGGETETAEELANKLLEYSEKWGKVADKLWEQRKQGIPQNKVDLSVLEEVKS